MRSTSLLLALAALPLATLAQVTPPGSTTPATPPNAASAQEPAHLPNPKDPGAPRKWSLHFQQTLIDQWHNDFTTPYAGDFSLFDRESAKLSFTSTFFLGRRLWKGGAVYFNPEVAGGSGLSAARGIAGFPNGETFRIGVADPVLYLARLYLRQTFALGSETDDDEDDLNQVAGPSPRRYFAVNVGKFSTADFFDQNSYSHDPRTQFMNWSLMSAGGWDYAANTRGYTVGGVFEYVVPGFAVRFGTTLMPTYANGPTLDFHYGTAHAETAEITKVYHLHQRQGTVRVLGFRNVAAMATYRTATALGQATGTQPDVEAVRRAGHTKLGFGAECRAGNQRNGGPVCPRELQRRQERNLGLHRNRPERQPGRREHRRQLAAPRRPPRRRRGAQRHQPRAPRLPGRRRLRLHCGRWPRHGLRAQQRRPELRPESIAEVYYSIALTTYHASISPDYQFIVNPGYNRDRSGPGARGGRAPARGVLGVGSIEKGQKK